MQYPIWAYVDINTTSTSWKNNERHCLYYNIYPRDNHVICRSLFAFLLVNNGDTVELRAHRMDIKDQIIHARWVAPPEYKCIFVPIVKDIIYSLLCIGTCRNDSMCSVQSNTYSHTSITKYDNIFADSAKNDWTFSKLGKPSIFATCGWIYLLIVHHAWHVNKIV